MRVVVACVGRLKKSYLKAAEDEYRKRLRAYCKLEVVEHKTDAALEQSIPARACVIVFDERGQSPPSRELAEGILERERQHGGGRPLYVLIGGADGHSESLRQRANHVVSFGRLTIAHRLVRILVLEQIYRAFSILAGEPYHRD